MADAKQLPEVQADLVVVAQDHKIVLELLAQLTLAAVVVEEEAKMLMSEGMEVQE